MAKPSAHLDLAELASLLTQLNFADNFESYIVADVSLTACEETRISYRLPNQKKAKYWTTLLMSGNGQIRTGTTAWTQNAIYLHNYGPNDVTATILILGS